MARPGGCRVGSRPQGGTLGPWPARSGRQLGADPRRPGNVSHGDAAAGGGRGAAAAAAVTVRASAACERTCGAAGGGGTRLGGDGRAGGCWDAGRRRPRGSGSRARRSTKSGAAPRRYRAGPGPRRAGSPGRTVGGRSGRGKGPSGHGAAGRRGPFRARFAAAPGGAEGKGLGHSGL